MGGSSPSSSSGGWRRLLTTNGAVLLGLAGLAVAQPLLDLLGRNPTYFVANDIGPTAIVAVAILITFVPPALLFAAELVAYRVGPRAGRLCHLCCVGLLGLVLGATLARHLSPASDAASVAIAFAVAASIVVGLMRSTTVALGLRYLAIAPLLVLGAFLFTSEATPLLFEGDAGAARAVEVGRPAPIVFLQLDELPLASLLRTDGSINATMFPNFARLAEGSTWYRQATSVSSGTNRSVPSIASGLMPVSGVPTSAEYPDNLFTLLGASYDLDVTESVTRLCPPSLCARPESPGPLSQIRRGLADAVLLFGHVALPPSARDSLPRVDRSWSDFFDQSVVPSADAAGAEDRPAEGGSLPDEESAPNPVVRGRQVDRWLARLTGRDASLTYLHTLLPHTPWMMTPRGLPITDPGPLPGDEGGVWVRDQSVVREALSLHLLQVQYVDTLVGRMIDRLDELGTWDDALVVVVADHGESFVAGESGRTPVPRTESEIFNVPLFIKYPGQADGELSDDNALTIDVVPTIVDALDIETDWAFDGESLLDPAAHRTDKPLADNESPDVAVPLGLDGLLAAVERNYQWFPSLDEPGGVAAVSPYVELVGRPVTSLLVHESSEYPQTRGLQWWSYQPVEDYNEGDPSIPVFQVGYLGNAVGAPPDAALLLVNDTIAGTAQAFECDGGECTWRGIIDESALEPRGNRMELLIPDPVDLGAFIRVPQAGSAEAQDQ